jgi:DNA-binding winged helix-turn-helix (wHTH) protein
MRLRFGECVFDSDTRQLTRHGAPLHLTPKAFQLLEILIRERPKAVSKQDLLAELWPDTFVVETNLANLVADLRAALGEAARAPSVIRTVQRFGYAFQARSDDDAPGVSRNAQCRLIWGEREIALSEGENILGRDDSSVAWMDVHSVSRRHARLVVSGDTAIIEDLGSKNGTFVNGSRVTGPTRLVDGDEVRVGTVDLLFRSVSNEGSTETARVG